MLRGGVVLVDVSVRGKQAGGMALSGWSDNPPTPRTGPAWIAMAGVWEEVFTDHMLINEIVPVAIDAALLQGVLMRTKEQPNLSEVVNYAPFSLLPSPVPKSLFDQAKAVQQDFNLLLDLISQDSDFLEEVLASTVKVDDFIAQLFKIYKQVIKEGIAQKKSFMFGIGPVRKATNSVPEVWILVAILKCWAEQYAQEHDFADLGYPR
ncbi:hypothetical protein NDU88_003230 [Pleurodeles waltl]|uniref:Uncharacterized protein n=1 Tax=Pleurodeles waltl TaxID=8319 RepID=A0AAV7PBI2_PLEWA|nr:hypothetical protein NDU88_003230 [Pleurodeles waltl]